MLVFDKCLTVRSTSRVSHIYTCLCFSWNEADESAKSSLSSTSRPCFLWVETKENILLSKDSQPLHNQLSYVNSAVLVHNDKSLLPDHCILSYFSDYGCIYLKLLDLRVFIRIKMFSGYSLLFVIYLFTIVLVGVIDIDIFNNNNNNTLLVLVLFCLQSIIYFILWEGSWVVLDM